MSREGPDHDALFVAVAERLNLLSPESLADALVERVENPSFSLGQILVRSSVIDEPFRSAVDRFVEDLRPHLARALLNRPAGPQAETPSTQQDGLDTTDHAPGFDAGGPAAPDPGSTVSFGPSPDSEPTVESGPPGEDVPGSPGVVTATQHYRVIRLAGSGGLGSVYLARDEVLGREVALKLIRGQYAGSREARARFLLEARITGNLEHPGIVGVHGIGDAPDGGPFYAMRFIKGDTLKEAIARFHQGDFPRKEAEEGERNLALTRLLRRFIDVCNAVAYAHSRGVLHRDLKPANIMVGKFGETLVVDWGLAKSLYDTEWHKSHAELDLYNETDALAKTAAGAVVGTPAYMSPEQAAGRQDLMEPASDVFGLGATLFTILTGEPPYRDKSPIEVIQRARRGDFPRPSEVRPEVQPALEAICLKAMAREPEDRYASPKALADDIERWLADAPVSVYREPFVSGVLRRARRYRLALVLALAAFLGTVALVTALLPGSR